MSAYDDLINKTKDLLDLAEKVWKPDPGAVSPFSSSSSMHDEPSDNHLEFYVKESSSSVLGDVSSMFNSDLFTNGGEKMTDKTLDVNASTTTNSAYENAGSSTTEPDPQSAIAIIKSAEMQPTTVGTTANTTVQAPSDGETTEPMEKAEDCKNCGKAMTLCECSGMTKGADTCSQCGQAMPIAKSAESEETPAEEAKETPAEEAAEAKAGKEEPMKKSSPLWNGAFAPIK